MRPAASGKIGLLSLGLLALLLPVRGEDAKGDALAKIKPAMQAFVDQQEVAGVVSVVGRKDGILSTEAVGMLNLEKKQPMTKDALFRIASMTKPITAIGIMILVDEGKLAIDDPVEKHLPEFKGQMLVAERGKDSLTLKKPSRPIVLRDLMTHTSGLPGGFPPGLADLYTRRQHTLAEAVLVSSQRPLDFEPGTRWAYCNAGIDVLGRVIEVVSGMSFEDFLQKRVFTPLEMKDTTFYPTEAQKERLAITYGKDKKDGKLTPVMNQVLDLPKGAKHPVPAGGLYSTGADQAKLYQMMLNKGSLGKAKILSPESVTAMTGVHTGDLTAGFGQGMGFGLGWAVVQKPMGATEMLSPGTYGHGGAFGTQGWIDAKQDLFVILLIQRVGMSGGDGSKIRQELQNLAVQGLK